jgi:hypothetical protein
MKVKKHRHGAISFKVRGFRDFGPDDSGACSGDRAAQRTRHQTRQDQQHDLHWSCFKSPIYGMGLGMGLGEPPNGSRGGQKYVSGIRDPKRDGFGCIGRPWTRFTSPQRGEVDLLLAMRSIVQCKSGEGVLPSRETVTPDPALRHSRSFASASLRRTAAQGGLCLSRRER